MILDDITRHEPMTVPEGPEPWLVQHVTDDRDVWIHVVPTTWTIDHPLVRTQVCPMHHCRHVPVMIYHREEWQTKHNKFIVYLPERPGDGCNRVFFSDLDCPGCMVHEDFVRRCIRMALESSTYAQAIRK